MHRSFCRVHPEEPDWTPNSLPPTMNGAACSSPCEGLHAEMKVEEIRSLLIYRVSKRKSTTENQQYAMEAYKRSLGHPVVERHICGTSWKKAIPQMQTLLEEIEKGRWKDISLWRVDRTGRNHEYDVKLWNLCVRRGVLLWYIDDDLRTDRPDDDLTFYEESVAAQKEHRKISKRTREGIARTRAKAKAQGRPDPFRGKQKGSLGARTKAIIPEVLALLKAGFKAYKISDTVNMNRATVTMIKNMPIEELRRKTGNPKLEPWQ